MPPKGTSALCKLFRKALQSCYVRAMTQELTTSLATEPARPSEGHGWWRDAVIYQVYVRSFADSDGDGIGDLRGVRERLPHLAGLGVDAVWLTPFYASPQADGGYDVADYRAVDPLFGTLGDADDLVRTAHELGLKVIVDVVPNHSSDQHPWFREALADRPGGAARARYHFRPGRGAHGELPPNDWESVFGGPAWTRTTDPDGTPGEWYLHLFAPQQPDLNWDSPRSTRSSTRCCVSGWIWAWTASVSMSPTAWSRPPGCPTSATPNRPS
ncbi:hypothetical protein SVIO_036560 [Streptomyces violaceusniger]|uniref:Glycosyl hydrolase family 13 catalytic domain-containing protein n=1 Tax=Streptomyces violaceusniger TaxID=68280 RepID=A0A4D4L4Z1_STRVO|nr:hypothetical protein SVIO_036560 [Streptomyces violaceusniger]